VPHTVTYRHTPYYLALEAGNIQSQHLCQTHTFTDQILAFANMQRTSAVFTPLNAYRNSLTVPSSHFTLEPVSISPANKAKKQAPKADNLAGSGTASKTKTTMSTRRVYDCFDSDKKGHFQAVDELFEKGVWIGYFAEES
jgi:hypothetical protein